MEPIRVLHLLHTLGRGGAECAIMNYYRHIDRTKVQFDFLITLEEHQPFEDEINSLGGKVFRVPLLTKTNPFPYLFGVSDFLREHKEYKIIHSHTSSKSFFPLFIAKLSGVPIRISHSHNAKLDKGLNGKIRLALKPFLKFVATDWLACGVDAGIFLYGKSSVHKFKVFNNVIETELYEFSATKRNEIRELLNISDDTLVIGHTARFSYQKNHYFDIEILKELLKLCPNTILLELGSGVKEGISDYAKQNGVLDNIIFMGVVDKVFDYEQAMDVFILPSFYEGLPLSIIEAQISGLPCFTTKGGVTEECRVTDLVHYLPLDANMWAEQIMKQRNTNRHSRTKEIIESGYDAVTSALKLQSFYIEKYQQVKI